MRSFFVLLLSSLFSAQLLAQSYINMQGQIKNSTHNTIIVSYSNSWLDPVTSIKTATLDDNGNFSFLLQFEEKLKPASIIYGTDTLELILTGGEGLTMTADGKDFLKTIHFEGTGGPNANFCIKHGLDKGRLLQFSFDKNVTEFKKALDDTYNAQINYLADNGKEITPMLRRYLRISYEYDKYCNMFQYPLLHHPDARNRGWRKENPNIKRHGNKEYNITDSIPEKYNDELLLMPQYRQYVLLEADKHDNKHLYPESREEQLNKFLYTTLPVQTSEYTAASLIYKLTGIDDKLAKAKLTEFKNHFPHSKYIKPIEYRLSNN